MLLTSGRNALRRAIHAARASACAGQEAVGIQATWPGGALLEDRFDRSRRAFPACPRDDLSFASSNLWTASVDFRTWDRPTGLVYLDDARPRSQSLHTESEPSAHSVPTTSGTPSPRTMITEREGTSGQSQLDEPAIPLTNTWVDHMPRAMQPYLQLIRIDKPIGVLHWQKVSSARTVV